MSLSLVLLKIVTFFYFYTPLIWLNTLLLLLFAGTKFSDFATFVFSVPQFSSNKGLLHVSYNTMKYYRLMPSLLQHFRAVTLFQAGVISI